MRREPPGAHFGKRHDEPLHRLLGGGDLRAGHLREVFLLKHLAVGNREPRVEFDLALFLQLVVEPGKQRLMDSGCAGLRRLRRVGRRLRQHHRQQLIDIAAAAEKDAERLIEQHRMFVAFHEYRMQCPVKVVAGADAGRLHRFQRIEHRARADRNAGGAQSAREVKNVFGEAAVVLCHMPFRRSSPRKRRPRRWIPVAHGNERNFYSAALKSDRTSSSSSFTLLPSSLAMSS